MAVVRTARQALGHPGIAPRWTRSAKDAVGTAYAASSRVWFTMSRGVLNEVYYPTVDRPQIRDLQYLITDGRSFFHDERRHLKCTSEYIDERSLGVRVTSVDLEQRYRIEKEIITSPHQACVLIRTRVTALAGSLETLRLFALLAPHLDGGGWGNSGFVAVQNGREGLVAHKGTVWLALAPPIPFLPCACGYLGRAGGGLADGSHSLLLAHEDKTYQGATIASLSIPWGEAKGDEDLGGYHLVWTRDMVHSALGLLASGNTDLPLRALIYLACAQRPDGGFYQNFWLDGEPYRQGIQLDEGPFPILLAWRLR